MFHYQKIPILACIIAAFFINTTVSKANQTCTTPNGMEGVCLYIFKCAPLVNVFRNTQRPPQESQYLRESQCDYIDGKPYVCCYIQQEEPKHGGDLLPANPDCAKYNESSWLALIEYTNPGNKKMYRCGASLISNRYVVTAAHCVTGGKATVDSTVTGVRLGAWHTFPTDDCHSFSKNYTDVGISEIILHPHYNSENHLNDIAVIRLNEYIPFSDVIGPICLPVQSVSRTPDVYSYRATGCRSYEYVNSLSHEECRQKYAEQDIVLQDTQLCACVETNKGNSVDALVTPNGELNLLFGIASFGLKKCSIDTLPDVYTRVEAYSDWIVSNIRE